MMEYIEKERAAATIEREALSRTINEKEKNCWESKLNCIMPWKEADN